MLAFPSMLAKACQDNFIKIPEDSKIDDWNYLEEVKNEFIHFYVFCKLQLCKPCVHGEHFDNAKIISCFSEENLQVATFAHFFEAGFKINLIAATEISMQDRIKASDDLVAWGVRERLDKMWSNYFGVY